MSLLTPVWLLALGLIAAYWIAVKRLGYQADGSQKWLLVSMALVIVALARPVLEQKPVSVEQMGSDVIVAVDLSHSMRATDIAPSRLNAAKNLLSDVVRSDTQDRFGVIGFTTSAIILSPLTKDTELLEHLFGSLDESQIITKGTSVMSALELARKMSYAKQPLVILLTDGGDEASYGKEADFVRDNNLRLSVVMLGTAQGSTLAEGEGTLKDEKGHIVVSARNDAIGEVVEASGGKMIEGADASAVRELINKSRSEDFQGKSTVLRYQELFYMPLILALIAFILSMTSLGSNVSKNILAVLALIGVSSNADILDFAYLYGAKKNYEAKNYERSAQLYAHVKTSKAKYNQATALYKAGKYHDALAVYHSIKSNDPIFKATLYYNSGNCYIRLQEFENARDALLKSLTLHYTKEADDNLRFIVQVAEQKSLNVRKEKKDQFQAEAGSPKGESKPAKQGGGSNMKSDMAAGGGGDEGKKVQSDPRLSMSQGKARLSSTQYELINQRSVHETKPW
ncbi:MAG: Ca-activated chloride channel [Campylobacterota bacterium]|nr:Ca-activated chloride channel [Campylobacterota bacterium]